MSHSTATAGTYYNSGSISFSSLRSNFRAQQRRSTFGGSETFATDNNPISASDLLRVTSTSNTNPVVPNATENANITTSSSNWKTSDFRGSIKYYYVRQTGTNTNVNINNLSWNSNRDKNVRKVYFVDGTIGSNAIGNPAASMSGQSVNLRVLVSGDIFGAAGRGGGTGSGAPSISGQGAGDAFSSNNNSNSQNIVIQILSGGRIYGGGGGGEKGNTGATGSQGTCRETTTRSNCGSCPGCPSGWTSGNCTSGSGCKNKQKCNRWGNCWRVTAKWRKFRTCTRTFPSAGGAGGAGGNGGLGRGYNNQTGSLSGAGGSSGSAGNGCGAGTGATGETGGSGGDWGGSGGNTNNSGSGGGSGRAIFGARYSVEGANSSTVKGSFNP